jgi:uncharacterized membrane protein
MHGGIRSLNGLRALLARQAMVPSLLASLLAVALLVARGIRSGTTIYAFLLWNLFLAWIPYLASLWADGLHRRRPRRWWLLIIPGLLWLAFFPNAPYIITDLWHLRWRAPIPVWYDIGLVATFALTGLFLAVFSLQIMQKLVRDYVGRLLSWLFVFVALALGGLGIYLGRFLRWNSWDLILNPRGVLRDVAVRVTDPLTYPAAFGVTFLFAAILFICYLALTCREPA